MSRKARTQRDSAAHVLVVDDSALVRQMVTRMLAEAGYSVEGAGDGAAALQALDRTRFDLVVTDLNMPPPDGFSLIEAVRGRDPLLPVIVLTGSHARDVGSAVQAMRLGAQDYLCKPLSGPEQMVAAVQRALAQRHEREALSESQKMEAIGRVAGGMAHDFSNALGIILGTVSLLTRDPQLHGRQATDLEKIRKAAERAARLTRQLLAFSRKQVLQPKLVNLNQTIGDMRELLQSLTGETVHLSLDLADTLGAVRADAGQIGQCLTNLVMNACDALPSGGQVVIETADVDVDREAPVDSPPLPPGRYVCLSVSDDGRGIEPAVKAHLFEPFFTTKGRANASGLGLAVVLGTVTQHGGHVRVESTLGQGTAVRLYFQRAAEAVAATAVPGARSVSAAEAGESILVVEDDDELRVLLCRGLRVKGYKVADAPNGPAALALIERRTEALDVIVSDMVMPGGMTGLDLARRAAHDWPTVRVILMSGHARGTVAVTGDADVAGVRYLDKPFTIEVLAAKIREVLRGSGEVGDTRV